MTLPFPTPRTPGADLSKRLSTLHRIEFLVHGLTFGLLLLGALCLALPMASVPSCGCFPSPPPGGGRPQRPHPGVPSLPVCEVHTEGHHEAFTFELTRIVIIISFKIPESIFTDHLCHFARKYGFFFGEQISPPNCDFLRKSLHSIPLFPSTHSEKPKCCCRSDDGCSATMDGMDNDRNGQTATNKHNRSSVFPDFYQSPPVLQKEGPLIVHNLPRCADSTPEPT